MNLPNIDPSAVTEKLAMKCAEQAITIARLEALAEALVQERDAARAATAETPAS